LFHVLLRICSSNGGCVRVRFAELVVFVFSGSGCLFSFFLVFCFSLAVFPGFVRVLVVFVRIRFSHHHLPCWFLVLIFGFLFLC
jgi:hypothetical protein